MPINILTNYGKNMINTAQVRGRKSFRWHPSPTGITEIHPNKTDNQPTTTNLAVTYATL